MIAGVKNLLAEKKPGDWGASQLMTRKVLSDMRRLQAPSRYVARHVAAWVHLLAHEHVCRHGVANGVSPARRLALARGRVLSRRPLPRPLEGGY
jgi:hypothetical protein